MSDAASVLKMMKDDEVKFLDLRFTDPRGKMQHVTLDAGIVDEDMFAEGVMFDGSSIAGWKAINESDMVLALDPETAHMDPFFAAPTVAIGAASAGAKGSAASAARKAVLTRPASSPFNTLTPKA